MTHVPEHLGHADRTEPPKAKRDRPEPPKAKPNRPEPDDRPGKPERDRRPDDLPPPID